MAKTPPSKYRALHRPYSDDRNKGRRTGHKVKAVARDDEGFEDFAEMAEANEQFPAGTSMTRTNRIPSLTPLDDGEGSKAMSFAEDSPVPGPSGYVDPSHSGLNHEEPPTKWVDQSQWAAPASTLLSLAESDGRIEDEESREHTSRHARKATKASTGKAAAKVISQQKPFTPIMEEKETRALEDDIAAGLNDIGISEPEDNGAEEDRQLNRHKSVTSPAKPKPKVVTQSEPSMDPEGNVRRSTRARHKPLEYWRGERIILGRAEDGPAPCPVFKGFLTFPKEIPPPLGSRKRKRRGKSVSHPPSSSKKGVVLMPPEAGWDDDTEPLGLTLEYATQNDIQRRIAFTAKMMNPVPANETDSFSYQKIFGDDDFLASGILTLPIGGKKPMKGTKDNTYVFFCHAGAVSVVVHKHSFVLAPGGTFLVPRGNQYYIENISQRETVLFFAQARKVPIDEDDDTPTAGSAPPSFNPIRSSTAPRSSMPGPEFTPRRFHPPAHYATLALSHTGNPSGSRIPSTSKTVT